MNSPDGGPTLRMLRHGRVELALHELRRGPGRPLLLLHGLGEQTPSEVPTWAARWSGPVLGLDFCGHGRSTSPRGGGYTAEALLGDVDAVIAEMGEMSIVGRGLGAYVAVSYTHLPEGTHSVRPEWQPPANP